MMNWVEQWVKQDPNIHCYWSVPPKSDRKWKASQLTADTENVTVFTASRYFDGTEYRRLKNWSTEQLWPIHDEYYENDTYFDLIINQQPAGQNMVWRFMNALQDFQFASTKPVQMIRHLHDFNSPWKEHVRFPNDSDTIMDVVGHVYADRTWTKAKWDAYQEMVPQAKRFFNHSTVKDLREQVKFVNSPMNFERYGNDGEPVYDDVPEYVHMTGMTNSRKNRETTMNVAEFLFQRYNIETIITSQEGIEGEFQDKSFTECYPKCPYDKYLEQLQRGDLVICATDYETGGKTWFEQVASGQVLVAWEGKKPWLYEQANDDYPLIAGSKSDLRKLAAWAVENWDEAQSKAHQLREHAINHRSTEAVGKDTLEDMESLVRDKVQRHDLGWDNPVVEKAVEYLSDDVMSIREINDATRHFTDNGDKILELFTYTRTDLVQCLRKMGYEDIGTKIPRFKQTQRWV